MIIKLWVGDDDPNVIDIYANEDTLLFIRNLLVKEKKKQDREEQQTGKIRSGIIGIMQRTFGIRPEVIGIRAIDAALEHGHWAYETGKRRYSVTLVKSKSENYNIN